MPTATLQIETRGPVTWVWMNRPERHNAFDEALIAELTDTLTRIDRDPAVRVVVLAGRGKSFSAGGDLHWMQRQAAASAEDNRADAARLATLFQVLAELRQPTVARVHGAALGGGMGLAAACDICVASQDASFATSEVRLGLLPAVISPYVIRAIGARQCLRYFQTGERIDAESARQLGLVHALADAGALDETLGRIVEALLQGGPNAQAAATGLIRAVTDRPIDAALRADTASRIAELRATPEAAEGLAAFLDKRSPSWIRQG